MNTEETLENYFKRSGDTFISPGYTLTHPDKGFLVYTLYGDYIVVQHCYGDGKYWHSIVDDIAKDNKKTKIKFATKRNPATFVRKYGCTVTGYILEREVRK